MKLIYCFHLLFGLMWMVEVEAQSPIQKWEGRWTGNMLMQRSGDTENEGIRVPVEMQIAQTDTPGVWLWITHYKGNQPVEKKYTLKALDEKLGRYITDEGNGIILPMQLIGNRLYSRFEVMGNFLSSCYALEGDTLVFEVISGSTTPETTSGGTQEDIPVVKAFPIGQIQRSTLIRQK